MTEYAALALRHDAACTLALEAGRLLVESKISALAVQSKGKNDVVTEMDRRVESMVHEYMGSRFPEDRFFGEEHGSKGEGSGGRWIIDPIDGTENFVRGIPDYTISLGYEDPSGKLSVGIVYNPPKNELFSAIRGQGAWLNGKPIRVSEVDAPGEALTIAAPPLRLHDRAPAYFAALQHVFLQTRDMRDFGSAAQDLCYIACGRGEAFFEVGLKDYDIAAALVILLEAGGSYRGINPTENPRLTGNILATNKKLQQWYEKQLEPFSLS